MRVLVSNCLFLGKEVWQSDGKAELRKIDTELEGDIEIIFYHFSRNAADYAKTLSRRTSIPPSPLNQQKHLL